MKVKDYELYRSVYCGLCHSLKKRCGVAGRFIINYDFTFLALLLSNSGAECGFCYKKCIVSPFKGRKACKMADSLSLNACADMSVILTWWKIRDGIRDEGFFKALALRLASLMLKRGYKKAAKTNPRFADNCRARIAELNALEEAGCGSIDEAADKFALILSDAAAGVQAEDLQRILSQLLYQLGRLIYILDAYTDMEEDRLKGRYNPINIKYGGKPDKGGLETNIRHTLGFISSAYELLDTGVFTPLLENTVYLGLPAVISLVLEGRFSAKINKNHGKNL